MNSGLKFNFGSMSLSSIQSDRGLVSDVKQGSRIKFETKSGTDKTVPFVEEDAHSDIALVVEGKRLYTSRALLSMSSPVLTRMLQSPEFKDKPEVPLMGKSHDNILELLYILHPAYQRKLSDQSVFMILELAEEYQIWNLKQKCEETLLNYLNNEKQPDLLIKCLQASDQYKLFALWTKCLQLFSKPSLSLSTLQRCHEYESLSRFLKSMLEAFKGVGSGESLKSPRESLKSPEVTISTRRPDNNTLLINETNLKKAFSNTFTQTKH